MHGQKKAQIKFSDYHDFAPVLSPDGKRLYFASTNPAPGKTEEGDVNVWYSDLVDNKWGTPVYAESLNTPQSDWVSFVDRSGTIYFISGRSGNLDVYTTRIENNSFTAPTAVAAWNTELDEEYVSLNNSSTLAFIQRTKQDESTGIFWSKRAQDWTAPEPLVYPGKLDELLYVQRWPRLSNDESTFYLVAQGFIYQFPFKTIANNNALGIAVNKIPPYKPLKIQPRQLAEPEVFGGLALKTNNGISFTADGKTAYLSRYTAQRDTSGGRCIKIFESTAGKNGWSTPRQVSFMNDLASYEYHPVLSHDGERLFYNSRAARPGDSVEYHGANNIWMVKRTPDGKFGTPEMIDMLATERYDDYASVTRDGTLYFRSDRPGGMGGGDIYRSKFVNGKYQSPESVTDLNSTDNENDVCIDPFERFIIFNRYIEATREIKLFLSIRAGANWTTPRVITPLEKDTDWELTPTLSPDGKYFFYEVNSNILRVPVAELFTPEERRTLEKS